MSTTPDTDSATDATPILESDNATTSERPVPAPSAIDDARIPMPIMGAGSIFGFVVLILTLTWVGLARVQSQTRVLELGEEIKTLSDERTALLKRLRRLETERAYLRRPGRVRAQASELLGMIPLDPSRRQQVRLEGEEVPTR